MSATQGLHPRWGNPAGNPELGRLDELPAGARLRCDAVVVGSGAGGAVTAATLADAGLDVVVLEEGPQVTTADLRSWSVPQRLSRLYRDSGLTAALGVPPVALPQGRCIGGTTTVNSGTCFRPPAQVLRRWAASGLGDLAPDALAPLLTEVELAIGVRQISPAIAGGNAEAALRGAAALGLEAALLHRNERGCIGSGQCPMGCPQGAKQDMRMTFLPRAAAAGARIHAGVRVRRLLRDRSGSRVVGVEAERVGPAGARRDGPAGRITAHAPLVVLAAGAVWTPVMLMRAGLGGRRCGRNLAVHPCVEAAGFVEERVEGWHGVQQSAGVRPEPGVTIEATFPPGGTALRYLPLNGAPLAAAMARLDHAVLLGVMALDGGNGRVRLLPGGMPLTTYRLGEVETGRLLRGLAHAARVLRAAGAAEVYTPLRTHAVLPAEADAATLETASGRDLAVAAFHPMGTARMSASPEDGVAGPDGRVWGVDGLAIADASLLPSAPGVNPQVTIMALALHVARRLVERRP
jgi:choline dehydrogenase-like flavoprotein